MGVRSFTLHFFFFKVVERIKDFLPHSTIPKSFWNDTEVLTRDKSLDFQLLRQRLFNSSNTCPKVKSLDPLIARELDWEGQEAAFVLLMDDKGIVLAATQDTQAAWLDVDRSVFVGSVKALGFNFVVRVSRREGGQAAWMP